MSDISNFMKKLNVDADLSNRVKKYLAYIWETDTSITYSTISS